MPSGNAGLTTRINTVIPPTNAPYTQRPVFVIAALTGSVAIYTMPKAKPPTVKCQYQGKANIWFVSLPTTLNNNEVATIPANTPPIMR